MTTRHSDPFEEVRRSSNPYRVKSIPAIPANDGFPLEPPSEVEGGFAVTAPSAALQGADHRTPLCFSDRLRRMTPNEIELLAEVSRLEKMGASWPILRRALEAFQNAVRHRHGLTPDGEPMDTITAPQAHGDDK
ncbi:MAG: hypothetical protein GX580_07470 [Candidatus Hydrogenedens sp.]|nr:hypothetical protein [Candidatus Hydrogenedens sp.]